MTRKTSAATGGQRLARPDCRAMFRTLLGAWTAIRSRMADRRPGSLYIGRRRAALRRQRPGEHGADVPSMPTAHICEPSTASSACGKRAEPASTSQAIAMVVGKGGKPGCARRTSRPQRSSPRHVHGRARSMPRTSLPRPLIAAPCPARFSCWGIFRVQPRSSAFSASVR